MRPAVDVVVPVAATAPEIRALLARMRALRLEDGDSLTVVDNRGAGVQAPELHVAAEVHSSYHARNAGAARGRAPWILFLDADVRCPPDLLARLFEPAPRERTAILAGGVVDEPPGEDATAAVRYAWLRRAMDQRHALGHGFAQTANCAVRRSAFEAVGGFAPNVRSGGDADLALRLRDAGWGLEERPGAAVVHTARGSVAALLAQRARHGAGAAWLGREHPGALPRRAGPGLALWAARRMAHGAAAAARGDRDEALLGLIDGPAVWAFELGRLLPNVVRARAEER